MNAELQRMNPRCSSSGVAHAGRSNGTGGAGETPTGLAMNLSRYDGKCVLKKSAQYSEFTKTSRARRKVSIASHLRKWNRAHSPDVTALRPNSKRLLSK